jgi:hypothetical protein
MRKTFIEKISIDGQTFRTYKQKEKQMKIKDQKSKKLHMKKIAKGIWERRDSNH